MRVLITSGGTTEYIDDVRVLTNISTGRLGTKIAEAIASCVKSGEHKDVTYLHEVTYICNKSSTEPKPYDGWGNVFRNIKIEYVTDVTSLMTKMEELVPKHDIIIHAMAVSDFGFNRDKSVKLKSSDPQAFIEYMRDNIKINPKVISQIKKWNQNCKLVGFKFEVGKTNKELLSIAHESFIHNGCDLVIANDKAEMQREKEHIAYPYCGDHSFGNQLVGKEDIANYLLDYVNYIQKFNFEPIHETNTL